MNELEEQYQSVKADVETLREGFVQRGARISELEKQIEDMRCARPRLTRILNHITNRSKMGTVSSSPGVANMCSPIFKREGER